MVDPKQPIEDGREMITAHKLTASDKYVRKKISKKLDTERLVCLFFIL